MWDADFYVKMDDNVGLNLGELIVPAAWAELFYK